jgi:hypothetical protein
MASCERPHIVPSPRRRRVSDTAPPAGPVMGSPCPRALPLIIPPPGSPIVPASCIRECSTFPSPMDVFTRTGVVRMRISAVAMRVRVVLVRIGAVLMRIRIVLVRLRAVLMHHFMASLKLLLVVHDVLQGRLSRTRSTWTVLLHDLIGPERNRRLGPGRPSTQEHQTHHHQNRARHSFHHRRPPFLLSALDPINGSANPVATPPRCS